MSTIQPHPETGERYEKTYFGRIPIGATFRVMGIGDSPGRQWKKISETEAVGALIPDEKPPARFGEADPVFMILDERS